MAHFLETEERLKELAIKLKGQNSEGLEDKVSNDQEIMNKISSFPHV